MNNSQNVKAVPSSPAGHSYLFAMIKRIFDFVFALAGLIMLSPLLLIIALKLKFGSSGQINYSSMRVGRNGILFKIYKFQTMVETEAANNGPRVTAKDDRRITPFGRVLRKTKMNELPQLINVLRGEMSLVGPRPEDPSFVEHYDDEQREVLSVRPGITSLASVIFADEENQLSTESVTDTYLHSILPKKLRLDLLYVRNQSMLLDLDILLRTMVILFPRFRKVTPSVEDMLLGPMRILRRFITWFSIDTVIAFLAVGLAGIIWRKSGPLDLGFSRAILAALIMTGIFTILNALTGVQRIQWRYASSSEVIRLIFSVVASVILLDVLNHAIEPPRLPDAFLILSGFLALSGFIGVRYRRRLLAGLQMRGVRLKSVKEVGRERVLIVGAGEAGQLTLWLLKNNPIGYAFQIIGIVDDDLTKLGTLIHRVPILGMCDRIADIVEEQNVGTIVFSIHTIDQERRNQILKDCWNTSARTVVAPDILTFMRKGIDKNDRRTWFSTEDDRVSSIHVDSELTEDTLKQRIHDLAELARRGDYAALTEELEFLDHEIGKEKSEEVAPALRPASVEVASDEVT